MLSEPTSLPDVILMTPRRFSDSRGFFMEAFRQDKFERQTGLDVSFVQDNQSLSSKANTIRGLHFQAPPHGQGKLVRCLQGGIIDVAVDIRVGSPNFGKSVSVELTSDNDRQLWIPSGFLHGFRTLFDDTIVGYKCTSIYAPNHEGTVIWNDPVLDIDWGTTGDCILSDRDNQGTPFTSFVSPFKYEQKA